MGNKTIIYFVRHGQSIGNVKGIISGNTPLTPLGREQAKALGEKLKDIPFAAVYSSDYLRARETAELVIGGRLPVIADSRIRERSYGKYEGRPESEYRDILENIYEERNKLSYEKQIVTPVFEGYETDSDVADRTGRFFRELAQKHPGKTILVAAHSSMMRAFLSINGWTAPSRERYFHISHTAYAVLEVDGDKFTVLETSGIR